MKESYGMETMHQPEVPHSLELAQELENTDDDELIREKLGEMIRSMEEDLGVSFASNVSEVYKGMKQENCLVRTERLSRVLETLEKEVPLKISDEDERHFANATIPEPEGIRIAFAEGQAPGPVRLMVGFGKTIIGFKTDRVSVEEVEFNEDDPRDAKERKFLCRHVTGELAKEDIRYVVMRIPYHFMEEAHLTDDERKRKPTFVFRGAKMR